MWVFRQPALEARFGNNSGRGGAGLVIVVGVFVEMINEIVNTPTRYQIKNVFCCGKMGLTIYIRTCGQGGEAVDDERCIDRQR